MSRVIKSQSIKTVAFAENQKIRLDLVDSQDSENDADDVITKATKEAKHIIENAKNQANIIINTAHSELEDLFEQVRLEGHQEGIQIASAEAQQLIDHLQEDIELAKKDRHALLESLEPDIIKLLNEVVEKVIRHEIKTDSRVVIRMIKFCLKRIRDGNDVIVKVNPAEIEHVKACREELLLSSECIQNIQIIDDRRINAGGCIVESGSGTYDARIETQLEKIRKKIAEIAQNEHASDSESE